MWVKRNGLSYVACLASNEAESVQLLVESNHEIGWDWTVWQAASVGYRYRRGTQASLEQAKAQAGEAATQMLRTETSIWTLRGAA